MDQCKTCASCRESKPVDEFHRSSKRKDGREPYCKACRSKMHQGIDPRKPDPNKRFARPGEKLCARCQESRPPSEFRNDRSRPDGLFPYCRECKNRSDSESHQRHRGQRAKDRKAKYDADPEYARARALAYYRADPEPTKRRATEWAQANPERRKEIVRASFRKAWEADPERFREAWRKRQAAVRMGCRVYGVTVEQIQAKVAYWGHKCWMCSGPYDSIDHVKPLAKGGIHALVNLRPACTGCNSRKSDRWPFTPVAA